MANVSGASLNGIYNRLHNAPEYHPLSANTFADWSLEAGDIVTVTRDGKSYASPTMNSTTVWRKKQQVTLNATGNEQRDTVAKMSQRKFRGGGASLRATQKAFDQIITSYNEMTAGLVLASSTAHLYVDNKYTQMTAGLNLTSSTAKLYVDNKYSQMTAGLALTSSTAKLYVDNKYAQMTAGLNLTSSTAKLYVDNKYSQMKSGLELTSSWALLAVQNAYTQMKAGLYLTSSDAHLYVDNRYSQMTSGLALSESSAKLYAQNRTTRAYIMARINADGEGEALIEADKVKITGTTKLNDVMTITNNAVGFSKPAIFSDDVSINSGGELNVYTINLKGSTDVSLDKSVMSDVIIKADVDGNVLKLWKMGDSKTGNPSITFSKAVSSWTWAGGDGQVKVTAHPQNQTLGVDVRVNGDETITSNGTYTYKAQYEDDNGSYWDIGGEGTKTITVNVPQTSYYSRTMRCTGKEPTYPGSTTNIYTFTLEGSYSFSTGSNYTFYRTSW